MTTALWTTGRVARLVGAACEGPEDRPLTGVASLLHAGVQDLSFCSGGRWLNDLQHTRAGAVLVGGQAVLPPGVVGLRVRDPRLAYARIVTQMVPLAWPEPGIHPTADVHPTARTEGAIIGAFAVVEEGAVIGRGSWLMAHSYVGAQVEIGQDCRLMPHAVVMERCVLGDRVWLKPGAVVGADGFGHVQTPEGTVRVPQMGIAVLEDDVEVGANACVDRAALDETRVGQGTRLDNLVQIAHGVQIGANSLLAAFAGVAGGAKLGKDIVMAGRTAVRDGIEVGDGAIFGALASASKNVPAGARLGGYPARRYSQWLREVASLKALPEWNRLLARLERRVTALEVDR